MRAITREGLALIQRFEGFSATPYQDQAGVPTIGYGHAIRAGEVFSSILPHEALELLSSDVRTAQASVLRLIAAPLSDGQYDALVSFVFNLGGGKLQASTLRRKINRGEYAADEFLKWVYAGGIKRKGLLLRRQAERAMYLSTLAS